MRIASLQVGPLDRSTPLTAQTTRSVGIHIPYMVWVIKINIFPIFTKNLKNCITAYGNFEQL